MECAHCGLTIGPEAWDAARTGLTTASRQWREPVRLPRGEGWHADDYTFRIAASRAGLWYTAQTGHHIDGHASQPARGTLAKVDGAHSDTPVVLAVLARPGDPDLCGCLVRHAPFCDGAVVMLDTEDPADPGAVLCELPAELRAQVEVIARPLNDDFGAQRNAAQQRAGDGWVFHLDVDETLPISLLDRLSILAGCCEDSSLRALGFARCNRVDGTLSDHFPDVQYRLVHGSVRFAKRVHERPDACDDWPTTSIWLGDAIDHHLSSARVHRRDRHYDALGQDAERHGDAVALLREYRP